MLEGKKAPNFSLPSTGDETVALSDYLGQKVVLYFYPKNFTASWITQAGEFDYLLHDFSAANTVVLGISTDSLESHKKFKSKFNLNFKLLSDEDKEVHKLYDTWQLKEKEGDEYFGTVRSTFIIDESGTVIKEYRSVDAEGHAKKILDFIENYDEIDG